MTITRSRGYVQKLASAQSMHYLTNTAIALNNNGASEDSITTTTQNFLTSGFNRGQKIYIRGATDTNDNLNGVRLTSVAAQTMTIATGSFATGQTEGSTVFLLSTSGGSFIDIFNGGTLYILSGTRRSRASAAGSGTVLVQFDNVEFSSTTSYDSENYWQEIALQTTLSTTASASGTATWFCLCAKVNGTVEAWNTAESDVTQYIRLDGSVGTTTSYDLRVITTAIESGVAQGVSTWEHRLLLFSA